MLSGVWRRETCGCLGVKAESFVIAWITEHEDGGPAFSASTIQRHLYQDRSNIAPLSCGDNRYRSERQCRERSSHPGEQDMSYDLAVFIGYQREDTVAGLPQLIDKFGLC